ncbi:Uncharacterised protein [Providencia stuartii]|nr:Uncharacterised protein [Providencia stuartii]
MFSEDLITLSLKLLSCTQKELATDLNVSPTQISKWKKGEYMSQEMEERIRKKIAIGDLNPSLILLTGSVENAIKWNRLILFIADLASENAETGYTTLPLVEDTEFLSSKIMRIFADVGIKIPTQFPQDLDIDLDIDFEDDDYEVIEQRLNNNLYACTIKKVFDALNDLYGFYAAYISDFIMNDSLDLFDTDAINIEACLIDLAITKVDIDISFAPKFYEFTFKINNEYSNWLHIVKNKAFQSGIPLRAELLNLVNKSHDELGHEAEAESLGFNYSRIHPDIYMNEILTGIRVIHQVLPKIMDKLGIDDFVIDKSNLSL